MYAVTIRRIVDELAEQAMLRSAADDMNRLEPMTNACGYIAGSQKIGVDVAVQVKGCDKQFQKVATDFRTRATRRD